MILQLASTVTLAPRDTPGTARVQTTGQTSIDFARSTDIRFRPSAGAADRVERERFDYHAQS